MSEKMGSEQWRNWSRDSTERQGRERDLETYDGYLGFKREELDKDIRKRKNLSPVLKDKKSVDEHLDSL